MPVVGDWDGNGTATPGFFRDGMWYLRNSTTAGPPDRVVAYGLPGDVPVVGDWDGNGTDTPGIVRGNLWKLSNTLGGPATIVFTYYHG